MKKIFVLLLLFIITFIPSVSAYTFISHSEWSGWVSDPIDGGREYVSLAWTRMLVYTDQSNYTLYYITAHFDTTSTVETIIVHNGTITYIHGTTTITQWGNVSGIYTSGTQTFIYTNFSTYTHIVGGGYTIIGHPYPLVTIVNSNTTKVSNILGYWFTYIAGSPTTLIFSTTSTTIWNSGYTYYGTEDGIRYTLSNYIVIHTVIGHDYHTLSMDPKGIFHTYYAYWVYGGETNIHIFTNLYYSIRYDNSGIKFSEQVDADRTTITTTLYALHAGYQNTSAVATVTTIISKITSTGNLFAYVSTSKDYYIGTPYPHYVTFEYHIYGYGFEGTFTRSRIATSIITIITGTINIRPTTFYKTSTLTGQTFTTITTKMYEKITTIHYDPDFIPENPYHASSTSLETFATTVTSIRSPNSSIVFISSKLLGSKVYPILSTSYQTGTTTKRVVHDALLSSTVFIVIPATVIGERTFYLQSTTVTGTLYSQTDNVEYDPIGEHTVVIVTGYYRYTVPKYYSTSTIVYTIETITFTDLRTITYISIKETIRFHIIKPYFSTFKTTTETSTTTTTLETYKTNYSSIPIMKTTKTSITTVYTNINTTKISTKVITSVTNYTISSITTSTKTQSLVSTVIETITSLSTTTSISTSTSETPTTPIPPYPIPPLRLAANTEAPALSWPSSIELEPVKTFVVIYTNKTILTKTISMTKFSKIIITTYNIYTQTILTTLYETTVYIATTTTITMTSTTNITTTTVVLDKTTTIYTNYSSTAVKTATNTITNSMTTTVVTGTSPTYTKLYITTYYIMLQLYKTTTVYVATSTVTLTTTITTTIISKTVVSSGSIIINTSTITFMTTITYTTNGTTETTIYSSTVITTSVTSTVTNVLSSIVTTTSYLISTTEKITPGVTTTINRTVYITYYRITTTIYNVKTLHNIITTKSTIIFMTIYTTSSTPISIPTGTNLFTNITPIAPDSVKEVTAKTISTTFYLIMAALFAGLLYFTGNAILSGNWGLWKKKIILTILGILVIVLLPRILDWIANL